MLEPLRETFYNVMHKYQIFFSETGVNANLNLWNEKKSALRDLLRKHPNWQEKEQAIVFDVSEERGIDRGIVDESKFELFSLAEEILNDKEQYIHFSNAINAATMDYSRVPNESRLEEIRQNGNISCAPGQKASRIINRLCQKFGIDTYEVDKITEIGDDRQVRRIRPYNAVFARLADALNPVEIHKKAVLSIHPSDFLEMSNRDNSWSSCHCLEDGCYKGGCQSYMGDDVSMIFFTVDNAVTEDFYKAVRLTREIFCYQDGLLLQSRLYPTDNEEQKRLYRHSVQKAIALCLDIPNLWTTKRNLTEISEYWNTAKYANHYEDYDNGYASLSFLSGWETYGRLTIGSIALCPCCGEEQSDHEEVWCGMCVSSTVCKDCGHTVPLSQTQYLNGAYYCKQCIHSCAVCHCFVHGTVYPAFDKFGNLTQVCSCCYEQILEPCGQCSVQDICSMFHGKRFCPYTAVPEYAAL